MTSSIAFVAATTSGNALGLVSIAENKMIAHPVSGKLYPPAQNQIKGAHCHPIAPLILTCNTYGLSVYNYITGDKLAVISTGISWGAKFSSDGEYVALAFDNFPFYKVWKLTYASDGTSASLSDASSLFPALTSANNGMNVDWSGDGKYLAVTHWTAANGNLSVINLASKTLVSTGISITTAAWSLQFSPDSSMLAIGGSSGLFVYRTDTWALVFSNTGNGDAYDVAWSPDGTRLVASTAPVTLYSVTDYSVTPLTFTGTLSTGRAWAVGMSPDNKYAVVGYNETGSGCARIDLLTYVAEVVAGTDARGSAHGTTWPVAATVRNIGIPPAEKIQVQISNADSAPILDNEGGVAVGRVVVAFKRDLANRLVEHGRGVTDSSGRFQAGVNFTSQADTVLAVILGADETEGSVAVDWVR